MRATGALILLGALTVSPAATAWGQRGNIPRQIRENQQRIEEIRQERTQLQRNLEQLRGRLRTISSELENIDQQKSVTSRMVNELDRQIGGFKAQLDTVTLELMLAQDALAEKRAVLEKRLVQIYKRGPLWMVQVLLVAETFGELTSRYKYLYLVSRQDRALEHEVEDLRDRVSAQRRNLLNIHRELGQRREQRGDELDRYVTLERRRQRALTEARATQRATATRLDSLARDEERLGELVIALERERRRAIASGARARAEGTISTRDLGTLDWPVDGEVIYRFGPAPGPDNTRIRHQGIGISAPMGSPVRAVASGTVELAGLMGTYGPTILIDHGGGFYTLYLYLSRFDVQGGEWVEQGQVIAGSGGANSDQGSHLEFQLRGEGGIALDPSSWLKPRR